eukprot:3433044-Amphidinium_carterae.1
MLSDTATPRLSIQHLGHHFVVVRTPQVDIPSAVESPSTMYAPATFVPELPFSAGVEAELVYRLRKQQHPIETFDHIHLQHHYSANQAAHIRATVALPTFVYHSLLPPETHAFFHLCHNGEVTHHKLPDHYAAFQAYVEVDSDPHRPRPEWEAVDMAVNTLRILLQPLQERYASAECSSMHIARA